MAKKSSFGKSPLGSGGRFRACKRKMKAEGKSDESASAICASIGRKKYGKKRFQALATAGRKRRK